MSLPPRTETLTAEVARWLVTAEALDHVRAAERQLATTGDRLVTAAALRDAGLAAERARAVLDAAIVWSHARAVLDDRVVGPLPLASRSAWEQASDPRVAAWRARRFADEPVVVDLCAGIGVDTGSLAAHAPVVAVERHEARAILLRHNCRSTPNPVVVVRADARRPPTRGDVAVLADPSRRSGRRRARALREYGPPVPALLRATAAARGRAIVVSPAVSLADPDLPPGGEVEFVQVGSRLVEATVWTGQLARAARSATLLPVGLHASSDGDPPASPVGAVGEWLIEPVPAAVRARLGDALVARSGLVARRLASSRALLTSDLPPPVGPWWRRWRVEATLPARPRALRRYLRGTEDLPLAIATYGVDGGVDRWWAALGGIRRGDGHRRVHVVRTDGGAVAVVTRDADAAERTPGRPG